MNRLEEIAKKSPQQPWASDCLKFLKQVEKKGDTLIKYSTDSLFFKSGSPSLFDAAGLANGELQIAVDALKKAVLANSLSSDIINRIHKHQNPRFEDGQFFVDDGISGTAVTPYEDYMYRGKLKKRTVLEHCHTFGLSQAASVTSCLIEAGYPLKWNILIRMLLEGTYGDSKLNKNQNAELDGNPEFRTGCYHLVFTVANPESSDGDIAR